MAKENIVEQPEALGEAMNKTELFFEENGRKVTYVVQLLHFQMLPFSKPRIRLGIFWQLFFLWTGLN